MGVWKHLLEGNQRDCRGALRAAQVRFAAMYGRLVYAMASVLVSPVRLRVFKTCLMVNGVFAEAEGMAASWGPQNVEGMTAWQT